MSQTSEVHLSARLLTVSLVVLLLILAATYWTEHESDRSAQVIFQTRTRELQTERMLSLLRDAEIGQRGFLLTEDDTFLEPYTTALPEIEKLRDEFKDLISEATGDTQTQKVDALIDLRLETLADALRLTRAGKHDEAIAAVRTGRGKVAMDGIRAIVAEADQKRAAFLDRQQERLRKILAAVRVAEVAGLLVLAVVGITVLRQSKAALAAQRQASETQAAAVAAATAASKAKSAFLASMSHELRTPMTGIMGMADLLMAGDQTPEDRDITRMLARSAQTLLSLLNDILDLSKVEAGKLVMEVSTFRLSTIMEDASAVFGPAASGKSLLLDVQTAPAAQDVFKGDPKRFQQILFNLVGNAIKFTSRGSVTVRYREAQTADGRTMITVEVIDTGVGISESAQARLFQDFEQEDTSTSRNYGGTGLGLSISRRLVEMMGGTIGVQSVKGQGSRFFFSVPLTTGDEKDVVTKIAGNAVAAADRLRGMHLNILLAEDTAVSQHLITTMLSRWGHTVTAVSNGAEAVKAADARGFDIILMDMQMPVMDGPQAISLIRSGHGHSKNTPIIALTADAIRENHAEYLQAGSNLVATKPIDWHALAQQIGGLVDKSPIGADVIRDAPASSEDWRTHPLLDLSFLNELLPSFGPETLRMLIKSMGDDLVSHLADIRTAVADSDTDQIRRLAHKIGGITSQFGAKRLSMLARDIETNPSAVAPGSPVVEDLAACATETSDALNTFASSLAVA